MPLKVFNQINSYRRRIAGYIQRGLDSRLLRKSDLFDAGWYLADNPDLASANVDPLDHYLRHGGFEGRDPSADFHGGWYLERYPDVKKAGVNPLVHYLRYGHKEKRKYKPHLYSLSRMYDYGRQTNSIVYEDSPEQIFLQRPKVIGAFSGRLDEGEAYCPRPYVAVIKDAVIFGGESLVVVHDNLVLDDELVDFDGGEFGKKTSQVLPYKKGFQLVRYEKPVQHVKEGVLLSCGHDANYFHWLVECLPKLLLLDTLEEFKDVPLLIPDDLHKNLITALERLNVNNRQVIAVKPGSACRVDRLIFPSALSRIVDRYEGSPVFNVDIVLSHKWLARVSEHLRCRDNDRTKPWRKLFLTRRKGLRLIENLDELELMLIENGFEIVELDGTSLDLQIKLFSQASIVLAPTGASLTNMLFCQPGTRVIIFMSNHETTNLYFWSDLGTVMDLDVTVIAGQRQFNLTNYWSVHDDYIVNTSLVLEEIRKSLG